MTNEELNELAKRWVAYSNLPTRSPESVQLSEILDELYDLLSNDPECFWELIREIHRLDQTPQIDQALSAGPIEDLLTKHGEAFIGRVEAEAKADPAFAFTLGGVWRNQMSDSVWARLQKVWDRKGWDGIPS